MNDLLAALDGAVPLQGMLGYLNFSEGRPDLRFATQVNQAYGFLAERADSPPWQALRECLKGKLESLQKDSSAFRDAQHAQAVFQFHVFIIDVDRFGGSRGLRRRLLTAPGALPESRNARNRERKNQQRVRKALSVIHREILSTLNY